MRCPIGFPPHRGTKWLFGSPSGVRAAPVAVRVCRTWATRCLRLGGRRPAKDRAIASGVTGPPTCYQDLVDAADLLQVVAGPFGLALRRDRRQAGRLQLGALGQLVAQLGQLIVGAQPAHGAVARRGGWVAPPIAPTPA
jgi:hypothetical protein